MDDVSLVPSPKLQSRRASLSLEAGCPVQVLHSEEMSSDSSTSKMVTAGPCQGTKLLKEKALVAGLFVEGGLLGGGVTLVGESLQQSIVLVRSQADFLPKPGAGWRAKCILEDRSPGLNLWVVRPFVAFWSRDVFAGKHVELGIGALLGAARFGEDCAVHFGKANVVAALPPPQAEKGEKDLLDALAAVLSSFASGNDQGGAGELDQDPDQLLLHALQSLVDRARKQPKGLLDRLSQLVQVARQGQLRAKKPKKKKKNGDTQWNAAPPDDEGWETVHRKGRGSKGKGKGGDGSDAAAPLPSSSFSSWANIVAHGSKGKGKGKENGNYKGKGKGPGPQPKNGLKGKGQAPKGGKADGKGRPPTEPKDAHEILPSNFKKFPMVGLGGFKARVAAGDKGPVWVCVKTRTDARAVGDLALLHELPTVGIVFRVRADSGPTPKEPQDAYGVPARLLARDAGGNVAVGSFFKTFVVGKDFPEELGVKGSKAASTPASRKLATLRVVVPRTAVSWGAWINLKKEPRGYIDKVLGKALHSCYGWEERTVESRLGHKDIFFQGYARILLDSLDL
ncbi:rbcL [Symbiodinium sp. CCMP2456]|nr:rbcL [Symbiodinium sp. CCMP2456]